jgi:hypothetical protein
MADGRHDAERGATKCGVKALPPGAR